jgi:hypothetical protein
VLRIGVVSTPPQSVMTPRISVPFVTITILSSLLVRGRTPCVGAVKP